MVVLVAGVVQEPAVHLRDHDDPRVGARGVAGRFAYSTGPGEGAPSGHAWADAARRRLAQGSGQGPGLVPPFGPSGRWMDPGPLALLREGPLLVPGPALQGASSRIIWTQVLAFLLWGILCGALGAALAWACCPRVLILPAQAVERFQDRDEE